LLLLADDGLQGISGLRDVREIDFGPDGGAVFGAAGARGPGGRLRLAADTEVGSYFFRLVLFNRTGMRLLLGDSDQRKRIENRLALDFQFSG